MAGVRLARKALDPAFHRRVFVNCPFDTDYLPLLHAIVFTICDSGFEARTALDDTGSGESRIDKIERMLAECRLSIHDISRVERSEEGLPRLNMAFECGMAYGARVFGLRGGGPARDFLVLAGAEFSDKKTLSDLGGKDLRYHAGVPEQAVAAVRKFLAAKAKAEGTAVRDHADIVGRLRQFEAELPDAIVNAGLRLTPMSLVTLDYLSEWTLVAAVWIAGHP